MVKVVVVEIAPSAGRSLTAPGGVGQVWSRRISSVQGEMSEGSTACSGSRSSDPGAGGGVHGDIVGSDGAFPPEEQHGTRVRTFSMTRWWSGASGGVLRGSRCPPCSHGCGLVFLQPHLLFQDSGAPFSFPVNRGTCFLHCTDAVSHNTAPVEPEFCSAAPKLQPESCSKLRLRFAAICVSAGNFSQIGCENSCGSDSGGGVFAPLTCLCAMLESVCLIGNCESESATTNFGA